MLINTFENPKSFEMNKEEQQETRAATVISGKEIPVISKVGISDAQPFTPQKIQITVRNRMKNGVELLTLNSGDSKILQQSNQCKYFRAKTSVILYIFVYIRLSSVKKSKKKHPFNAETQVELHLFRKYSL